MLYHLNGAWWQAVLSHECDPKTTKMSTYNQVEPIKSVYEGKKGSNKQEWAKFRPFQYEYELS